MMPEIKKANEKAVQPPKRSEYCSNQLLIRIAAAPNNWRCCIFCDRISFRKRSVSKT